MSTSSSSNHSQPEVAVVENCKIQSKGTNMSLQNLPQQATAQAMTSGNERAYSRPHMRCANRHHPHCLFYGLTRARQQHKVNDAKTLMDKHAARLVWLTARDISYVVYLSVFMYMLS